MNIYKKDMNFMLSRLLKKKFIFRTKKKSSFLSLQTNVYPNMRLELSTLIQDHSDVRSTNQIKGKYKYGLLSGLLIMYSYFSLIIYNFMKIKKNSNYD